VGNSWGHGLNSLALLQEAVEDFNVDKFEVDVCWNSSGALPVMRHAVRSDLSVDEELTTERWIESALLAIKNGKVIKVIKFDFKEVRMCPDQTLKAYEVAMGKIRPRDAELPEIWLNADVVDNENVSERGIKIFFEACDDFLARNRRKFVIKYSLGWGTRFNICGENRFPLESLKEMRKLCAKFCKHTHLTFACRASWLKDSWNDLNNQVLEMVRMDVTEKREVSVTIWTGWEGIPASELDLIQEFADETNIKVFFDVKKGSKLEWHNPLRFISAAYDRLM